MRDTLCILATSLLACWNLAKLGSQGQASKIVKHSPLDCEDICNPNVVLT